MHAEGREFPLLLRHADVKRACRDWQTFSSDDPFLIVPHSEAAVRSVRQLPIETDPPLHRTFREMVEGLFKRPNDDAYRRRMRSVVDDAVGESLKRREVEVVRELALPIQSRGLALLLGVEPAEADEWIGWGLHVFREGDGVAKGQRLTHYVRRKFAEAEGRDGDDFFALLSRAEIDGRKLTLDEKEGFASVTFAGGRDTVIHTLSEVVAHCGRDATVLPFLRDDPQRITLAIEEYVRFVSPLTALARRCRLSVELAGVTLRPGDRVGLCWPSANRDESVFERPDELVLDRKVNPHLGFGFGIHHCLGAAQARLILRCLMTSLVEHVERVELLEVVPQIERESTFERQVGYQRLTVRLTPRTCETQRS